MNPTPEQPPMRIDVSDPHRWHDDNPHKATALSALESEQQTQYPDSWVPKNLLEINADPPAPPSLIESADGGALLYAGLMHIVSGEPEAGKTWVAVLAAMQFLTAGQSVLWIDTDGAGPG